MDFFTQLIGCHTDHPKNTRIQNITGFANFWWLISLCSAGKNGCFICIAISVIYVTGQRYLVNHYAYFTLIIIYHIFFGVRTNNLSINLAVPGFAIKYNHMHLAYTDFTLLFLILCVLVLTLNYFDNFYMVLYVHFKLKIVSFQKGCFDLLLKKP